MATFLKTSCETARWVRANIPSQKQVSFLAGITFRAEGGLVRKRLRWPIADELRRQMDFDCHGPYCTDAIEILNLMRADMDQLNAVRSHVC